jgi:hypothetical protein
LKEKFWLIPLLHISKSKSWRLHDGHYLRIIKYDYQKFGDYRKSSNGATLDGLIAIDIEALFKEYKDIFAWN